MALLLFQSKEMIQAGQLGGNLYPLTAIYDAQKMTPTKNPHDLPIYSRLTHPKGPKAKDDDDEVNDIGEEHESVDVSGSSVLGVKDPPEETLGRLVRFLNPAVKNTSGSSADSRKNPLQVLLQLRRHAEERFTFSHFHFDLLTRRCRPA